MKIFQIHENVLNSWKCFEFITTFRIHKMCRQFFGMPIQYLHFWKTHPEYFMIHISPTRPSKFQSADRSKYKQTCRNWYRRFLITHTFDMFAMKKCTEHHARLSFCHIHSIVRNVNSRFAGSCDIDPLIFATKIKNTQRITRAYHFATCSRQFYSSNRRFPKFCDIDPHIWITRVFTPDKCWY